MRPRRGDTLRLVVASGTAVLLHLGVFVAIEFIPHQDAPTVQPAIAVQLETRIVPMSNETDDVSVPDTPTDESPPQESIQKLVDNEEPTPDPVLSSDNPPKNKPVTPDTATPSPEVINNLLHTPPSTPSSSPPAVPTIEPNRYIEPRYPEAARRNSIEGTVVILLRIDRRGRVEDVHLRQSSGTELLDQEALRTARMWRFPRGDGDRESLHRIVFKLE